MSFYESLEEILQTKDPHKKIEKFKKFYQSYKEDVVEFEEGFKTKIFQSIAFTAVLFSTEICKLYGLFSHLTVIIRHLSDCVTQLLMCIKCFGRKQCLRRTPK